MKVVKIVTSLVVLIGVLLLSNCGGNTKPVEPLPDKQLRLLTQQTWKLTGVTLDSKDMFNTSGGYSNAFTLQITGTKGANSFNYAITGRPPLSPWKASGTWAFGADPATQIVRDPDVTADKIDVTYNVSDPAATLQISFNFQGTGYTRTDQVKGNWVFTFGL